MNRIIHYNETIKQNPFILSFSAMSLSMALRVGRTLRFQQGWNEEEIERALCFDCRNVPAYAHAFLRKHCGKGKNTNCGTAPVSTTSQIFVSKLPPINR